MIYRYAIVPNAVISKADQVVNKLIFGSYVEDIWAVAGSPNGLITAWFNKNGGTEKTYEECQSIVDIWNAEHSYTDSGVTFECVLPISE